jgi:GH24 family phage-related lysozyme (muramidase)
MSADPEPGRVIVALSWAAGELKVSTETARRWAEQGELPGAFKVGTQWRVSVPVFYREVERRASERPAPSRMNEQQSSDVPSLVRRRREAS